MAESTPSPKTILRGHKVQVHAAQFIRGNERLITGDAEGYVVLWDLTIMRPRAVWRAHENAILGVRGWGADKIITHGRDNKLIVWKIGHDDEENLSTTLPVESVSTPRPQPWILHLLEVNTMNFCSFSSCATSPTESFDNSSEILITVPNTLASEAIDIYTLPSQSRIHTLQPGGKNGMAMCLKIFHYEACLTLVAAFENGYASVHRLESDGNWVMTYRSQPHSQPILSLDLHPDHEYFITSSADSIIAKHPIPTTRQEVALQGESTERVVEIIDPPSQAPSLLSAALKGSSPAGPSSHPRILREWKDPLKVVNTKHSGQQSLAIRSDGRLFVTAGWDSKIRVYSAKSLKELAVLKWHQVGCYAVAFADIAVPEVVSDGVREIESSPRTESPSKETSIIQREGTGVVLSGSASVRDRRIHQAKTAHWVAAGAKDGKISLWDIY